MLERSAGTRSSPPQNKPQNLAYDIKVNLVTLHACIIKRLVR
jgi:hypothetical protein